jgi:5-methylcytosine-specific restriction endonuclease McrA
MGIDLREGKSMSNPRLWRAKPRTTKPNSRQKRNGLFLDAHPTCQRCNHRKSKEAHHDLPHGHPDRFDWQHMQALCRRCHIAVHQPVVVVIAAPTPVI